MITSFESDIHKAGYCQLQPALAGGSSRVWRARSLNGDTKVALKLLSPGVNTARLCREIAILQALDHPNIVPYLDSGSIGEEHFLATEWIEGETLARRLIRTGPQTMEASLVVLSQLVAALNAAHAEGIIHRDISPDNVLIDHNDHIMLIDFGIARMDSRTCLTIDQQLPGKPRYIAPETIKGEPASAASDQYSLAIMAYEMLTGQWPYPGSDSIANALHQHLYASPVPINEVNPMVSESVNRSLMKAMSKQPSERHSTLDKFLHSMSAPSALRVSGHNKAWRFAASFTLLGILGLGVDLPYRTISAAAISQEVEPPTICRPLSHESFESLILGRNYYISQDGIERIKIVSPGVVADSAAVEVGFAHEFGIYGVITPIQPGRHYDLSATLIPKGGAFVASLFIEWLDADFNVIEGERAVLSIDTLNAGRETLSKSPAPATARYAVPSVFKDGSSGELYVDDLTFNESAKACQPGNAGKP